MTSKKKAKTQDEKKPAPAPEPVEAALGEESDDSLANAEEAFVALRPTLETLSPDSLLALKGSLQRAAICAIGVAEFVQKPHVKRRFVALSSLGELRLDAVDALGRVAAAAWYVRHRLDAARRTASVAKLPATLDALSLEVRDRMRRCVEYWLGDDPEFSAEIVQLRAGTGFEDRANDLYGYARIYKKKLALLKDDKKNFRASDAVDAPKYAQQILRALGLVSDGSGDDWQDLSLRAWKLLDTEYAEVARGGRFLFRGEEGERLFPNLIGVSRDASAPSSKKPEDPDEKPK